MGGEREGREEEWEGREREERREGKRESEGKEKGEEKVRKWICFRFGVISDCVVMTHPMVLYQVIVMTLVLPAHSHTHTHYARSYKINVHLNLISCTQN